MSDRSKQHETDPRWQAEFERLRQAHIAITNFVMQKQSEGSLTTQQATGVAAAFHKTTSDALLADMTAPMSAAELDEFGKQLDEGFDPLPPAIRDRKQRGELAESSPLSGFQQNATDVAIIRRGIKAMSHELVALLPQCEREINALAPDRGRGA
jgi:hypothetical protein